MASAMKIAANAVVIAISLPIESVWPKSWMLAGKRARAAAGMFCAANTTWRSGATA